MSTYKSRPDRATPQSLSCNDTERLNTFMLDMAHALLPGTPARNDNGETRFGRKGSLAIRADGRWYDHEAGTGGHGGLPLIRHLLPQDSPIDAKGWAKQWLSAHQGTGSLTVETGAETETREKLLAKYAQRALDEMVDIAGTPGENYLATERGLTPPWPLGLGYWPVARSDQGEGALVAPLTDNARNVVGVHLVFLDGRGRKSAVVPVKQSFRLTSREAVAGACFRIDGEYPDPFSDLPADLTDPEHLHSTTIVCEGIEDALAVHVVCPYSTILGMPGVGRLKRLIGQLNGDIVVVRDGDEPGSRADKAFADGLDTMLLAGAQHIRVTATPLGKDANDILREQGPDVLHGLIVEAKPAQLSRDGDIKRLARMAPLDLTSEKRKTAAKRWDITIPAINRAITAERNTAAAESTSAEDQDQTGPVWDEALWSSPVTDIGAVLDEALAEIRRYVVTEEYNLATMCVWSLLTHIIHRDDLQVPISPRLAIQAAEKNCGKTTALASVGCMVLRPKPVLSTTAAAFFRIISKYRPTVLLDEADKAFRRGHGVELLQLINGGHSRGFTGVDRVEEIDGKREVVTYDAWGAVALAGIGRLYEATTQSRCIVIQMQRAKSNEQPEHMKRGRSAVLEQVRQKFARWSGDLKVLPDIKLPPGLINRTGDNWEPMLQLAHLAGPRWWDLILKAARADVASETSTDGTATPLLHDIRVVFGTKEQLCTEDLCRGLLALPDPSGEWRRCNRGGEVSAYYLRFRLRNLLDPPGAQKWKEGGRTVRGYLTKQFEDSFERYLVEQEQEQDQDQPLPPGSPKPAPLKRRTKTQAKRAYANDADGKTTDSGDEKDTLFGRKSSAPSAPSAAATNIAININGLDQDKTGADSEAPSATEHYPSATMPSGPEPVADGEAPVADGVSQCATAKMQSKTAFFPKGSDGADGADGIRGKRENKTQRPGNGLDQSPNHNAMQSRDKMQGPKEELW